MVQVLNSLYGLQRIPTATSIVFWRCEGPSRRLPLLDARQQVHGQHNDAHTDELPHGGICSFRLRLPFHEWRNLTADRRHSIGGIREVNLYSFQFSQQTKVRVVNATVDNRSDDLLRPFRHPNLLLNPLGGRSVSGDEYDNDVGVGDSLVDLFR